MYQKIKNYILNLLESNFKLLFKKYLYDTLNENWKLILKLNSSGDRSSGQVTDDVLAFETGSDDRVTLWNWHVIYPSH